ncbi:FKBP-type peptidyl-prolyl cis-trans isomerase [archaeon]|nr:MAG: FKBP-type peptidyl-prolyl cis-trans isomerase [archaeon]
MQFSLVEILICSDYVAYLEDGTCFDSSRGRRQPLNFVLGSGQIISGIEMVLPLMSRGTGVRIVIPPEVSTYLSQYLRYYL